MGKGIILRVLEGTVLSPELANSLANLLPSYKLEYFSEAPNYQLSFQRRIDSLHSAFLFILDAYPLNPKFTALTTGTLKSYVDECRVASDLKKISVDDLQKELEKFTAQLVDVVSVAWNWPKDKAVKEAIACLNEAEQYVLMSQGRPDLATLIPIENEGKTEYILQWDESIPPYYDQWIRELQEIKRQNYPKTPPWLRSLPGYQRAYFCNLKSDILDFKELIFDLNKFIESWEIIKDTSLYITVDLSQIDKDSQPYPAWFNELNPQLKEMVRALSSSSGSFDSNLKLFKEKLAELETKQDIRNATNSIVKIPEWYWILSDQQQCFLGHVLKKSPSIEEAVSFLSSRHRTLPAPANFALHSLLRINSDGESTILNGRKWRSSHIASRDALHSSQAVQQRHSNSNFSKITEYAKSGQPILMQTLISPIYAVDRLPLIIMDYMPELPPDLELYKIARETVLQSKHAKNTLQNNHPYNFAKKVYYTETNDPDSLSLLKEAKKYVHNQPQLQELLTDYKGVLESPLFSATFRDFAGRELFLSSLEQIIIIKMNGFSYGSCVSGKDRKAIELIHSDAMALYKERYGCWPKFSDPVDSTKRRSFVTFITELYCSRHQQEHAGQNAPGSEGIKTPYWYFTADIVEAINKRLGTDRGLEYEDRLATNNEVKYINNNLRSNLLNKNELHCKLMAKELGEKNCTALYDALVPLMGENQRFQKYNKDSWINAFNLFAESKKDNGSLPTGIRSIQNVMYSASSGKTNVDRLELIFLSVLRRPEQNETRREATISVYSRLRDLLKPCNQGESLQLRVDNAVSEWKSLFSQSMVVNAKCVI